LPSGNKRLPQNSEKALEIEVRAADFLRWEGYHIIHSGALSIMKHRLKRELEPRYKITPEENVQFEWVKELWEKLSLHSVLYDYLCKKGNSYFVVEVKYKIWKKGREYFNSSERQIREYNKVQKQGKVKVLTIINTNKELFYNISNWDDFEKAKVTIKPKFPELVFGKDEN